MIPPALEFQLQATDQKARAGQLVLRGNKTETPAFMPVGTNGTVKAITVDELKALEYSLILANTYHLHLRPGDELIRKLGGLHRFMDWDGAILTDSGGFQVFSLAKLNQVGPDGVHFQSHLDGSKHFLSPEKAVEIQENLGSDVMMVLDECLKIPEEKNIVARSVELTTDWAFRCLEARKVDGALFAIVQGGEYEDLRVQSAESLTQGDFDGFAIGGLSVGEEKDIMWNTTRLVAPVLPVDKPRYLMGVGEPEDILTAVEAGVDLFDCVLPTRNARNGCLYTSKGKISIKQARYKDDPRPLDENCGCEVCRRYSRAYLRHLYQSNEILSSRLNSLHNLYFYRQMMKKARQAIMEGRYTKFKKEFLGSFQNSEDVR